MSLWDRIFNRRDLLERIKQERLAEAKQLAERLSSGSPYTTFDDPKLAESSAFLRQLADAQQKKTKLGNSARSDHEPDLTAALYLLILLYRVNETINPGPPVNPENMWDTARLNSIAVLSSMFDQARAVGYVARFEEIRKLLCKAAPSGHHTPYQYWVLAIKQIAIEEAIRKLGLSLPQLPMVYYFPNGTVNALTFLIPDTTESLVLFEGGIQPFTNQASKILVTAFFGVNRQIMGSKTLPGIDQMRELILRDKTSMDRFSRILLAYLFLGNPIEGGFFTIQGREADMAGRIEQSMKLFAMGHEYGHILDAHTAPNDSVTFSLGSRSWRLARRSLTQEYDADRHGLRLMVEAMKTPFSDNVLSLAGADVLLCCIGIVERALSIAKNGYEAERESGTHPPIGRRRDNLRMIIQSEYADSQTAFAMMIMFEMILNTLFEGVKPLLFKYHREKKPLAPRWTSHIMLFT